MFENKKLTEELNRYKTMYENSKRTCEELTNKMNTPEWVAFEKSKVTENFKKAKDYLVDNRSNIIRESQGLSIKYTIKDLEIESFWDDYNFKDNEAQFYWRWKGEENGYFALEYGRDLFKLAYLLYEPK